MDGSSGSTDLHFDRRTDDQRKIVLCMSGRKTETDRIGLVGEYFLYDFISIFPEIEPFHFCKVSDNKSLKF